MSDAGFFSVKDKALFGWQTHAGKCKSCGRYVRSRPLDTCVHYDLHLEKHEASQLRRAESDIQRVSRWKRRIRVLEKLGGKCADCGTTDVRLLQINHKDGNGHQERLRMIDRGTVMEAEIDNGNRSTEDLDLRCANCNILYEYEVGRRVLPESV